MNKFIDNIMYKMMEFNTYATEGGTGSLGDAVKSVNEIIKEVFSILTPIVATLIGAFVVFKMVMIGIKIAQSSDEPEERTKYVKALAWWGVGLVVCIIAATLVPTLLLTVFASSGS